MVYARAGGAAPAESFEADVPFAAGLTVEAAIRASGLLERCPEIDIAQARAGVWGKARDLTAPAAAGDRVEIYRPLTADPKASRSQRVRKKAEAAKERKAMRK